MQTPTRDFSSTFLSKYKSSEAVTKYSPLEHTLTFSEGQILAKRYRHKNYGA